MYKFIKNIIKNFIIANSSLGFHDDAIGRIAFKQQFGSLAGCKRCPRREDLWGGAVKHIGASTPILYLEFGVY
jgi:hypothetical protein